MAPWKPNDGFQVDALEARYFVDELFGGGSRGGGKALANSAMVMTPTGPVRMDTISIGDLVIGADGKPTKVVGVFPQGVMDIYEVKTIDGSSVRTTSCHKWYARLSNRHGSERIYTTQELIECLRVVKDFEKNRPHPLIPITAPVEFDSKDLKIPPYLMGALLGDGSFRSTSVRFTSKDEEVIGYLKAHYPSATYVRDKTSDIDYRLTQCSLKSDLDEMGLWGKYSHEKWIPEEYIYNSIESRWELIQGLMDTDGYADTRGHCEYVTSSPRLAEGVVEVLRSLGFTATMSEKDTGYRDGDGTRIHGKLAYRVYIKGYDTPKLFKLKRKSNRCKKGYNGHDNSPWSRIVSITPDGQEDATCIKVEAGDGLFVCEDYIVTHNTDWLLMDFASDVEEWGKHWRGIIFRKTMSQFIQMIDRSKELFYEMFPGSRFYESKDNLHWKFPNGATLRFFHMKDDGDADKHQGLEYSWIGWDELPLFSSQRPYHKLKATLRSPIIGMPLRTRSTGNPGGPGLGWIKAYFKIPDDIGHPGGEIVVGDDGKTRMFLRSSFEENLPMLAATPDYEKTLQGATQGNSELAKAWIDGNFNVFFGRFFETFDTSIHRIDPYAALPDGKVPPSWRLFGCLDYGESSPTAFGLCAVDENGTAYLIAEYYKSGLWVSEHAGNIKDIIKNCPYTDGRFPERVFADTSIFNTRTSSSVGDRNKMVSDIFKNDAGIKVVPSNKNRISGWRYMKEQLAWKKNNEGLFLQTPRLYYFPECENFEREADNAVYGGTEDNPKEDMNTDGEDHMCFGADTLVMTPSGNVPISALPRNGVVMTSNGYQKYEDCKKIKENATVVKVLFDDGSSVIATPDHKFMTPHGWVVANLLKDETVVTCLNERELRCVGVEVLENTEDVYCLTSPSTGDFVLANGAIVHNCDAVRYFCMGAMKARPEKIEETNSLSTFKSAVETKKRDRRESFMVPQRSNILDINDLLVAGEDMWKKNKEPRKRINAIKSII